MQTLQTHIKHFTEQILQENNCYLVDFIATPNHSYTIYIDNDNGLPLQQCINIHRALQKKINEHELYPEGNYELNVSSPGISEPLKLHRQYIKNIGRNIEVTTTEAEQKSQIGKLLAVTDQQITIEQTDKKKKTNQVIIPFTLIKKTTVCVSF